MFLQRIISKIIYNRKVKKEGGEKTSSYARTVALNRYNVEIEKHTYGSCFSSSFNTGGHVKIGRYTSFGPNVRYFGANHPISSACMSPYFYRKEWGFNVKDIKRETLEIGNDVWIGCDAIITANCHHIGNGAIIGAGAVVTKDVEPYCVLAGNPTKKIKMRFDQDTIELLETSGWWNLEPEALYQFYNVIDDPKQWTNRIMEYKKTHCNGA